MGDIQISDLIKEGEIESIKELDATIERVKTTYVNAAKELAKGLKVNVEVSGDLDKLNTLYITQAKTATSASNELSDALKKQSEISQTVQKRIEERLNAEKLSTTEIKKLTKASIDNAVSLEKTAKAEVALEKAQNSGLNTRRKYILSEEERMKLIRAALALTNKEVHSKVEAKAVNKELQKAVDVLKDTDENYIRTLARLNSTIGINTDYVKRNSDRYTQQKMTVGAYREEVKAALIDLQNGNKSMQNMGIIAKNAGMMLKTELAPGLNQVHVGMKGLVSGYVGGQAVISGVVALFTKLREGVGSIVEFEFANSRLAAILGTTSDKIKELTSDAQRLGATTKYTASEATELQIELAKLGFTREEILNATESVLRFAQATGAELADAASLSGAALRMFNANTRETERYVSAMAVATSRSALSFSYLATALPIVGPVAKAFNFTIEDTLALLGKLADAGFDASMAATATRNILLNLADGSGKLAQALGKPVKNLPELVDGLKKLKEEGIDLNTTLELTDKRSVAAFNAFLTSADKIIPLREQITGVDEELADMAHTMENNVKGAMAGLDSAWEALMLTFSNSKGVMKSTIDFFARGIRNIANNWKSLEEKENDAIQLAIRNQRELSSEFKIEERYIQEIKDAWQEYMNSGIDSKEAFKRAVEDKRNYLSKEIEKYGEVADEAERSYQRVTKAMQDSNMFTRAQSGTSLSDYKKQRNFQFGLWSEAKKESEKYKYVLENVDAFEKEYIEQHTENGNNVKVLTDKEKRELEKAAQEKLKIQQAYQDSELSLMNEGLEKEFARIGIEYSKKIAAIKGYSKEEIATRENLAKEMKQVLGDYTIKYNSDREKKDIANALEVVKKGSKEELDLKISQLDLQREAEIDAAQKTGEDVFLINDKYEKKKQELKENYASGQILLIADNAAAEQIIRDRQYQQDILALKKELAEKKITRQEFNEEEYRLTLYYARKTSEAAINALEQELHVENLSAEDRIKITEQIQKIKAELAQKEAEIEIDAIEKVNKADDKAHKERIRSLQKWLQTSSQAIGTIGDLIATLYDGQIEKIESEQNANDEAYDRDVERIVNLTENGAISEEEAEARKRAAKQRTEEKNQELEKKKQELAKKQAIWDKATSMAQAGIATALAITQALPNLFLAAIVGAMGAIQVATIAATPIPSYAEGTKGNGHPGGKALVGDAGKREAVLYNGMAWITPDTPMIVDLPYGVQVLPDVEQMGGLPDWRPLNVFPGSFENSRPVNHTTVVNNNFSKLEKRVDRTNQLLQESIKQQRKIALDAEFELYKLRKL